MDNYCKEKIDLGHYWGLKGWKKNVTEKNTATCICTVRYMFYSFDIIFNVNSFVIIHCIEQYLL